MTRGHADARPESGTKQPLREKAMYPLGANQSWFTFSVGPASYAVYAFTGTERVNEPYEFQIEFVFEDSSMPTEGFLGSEGLLSIMDKNGVPRLVHGIIRQIRQLHTGNRFTHYQCVLVPRLWFLRETVNHRIFQNKEVKQIIDEVLAGQRFVFDSYEFRLNRTYPKREYCTQYGESDLHFISRLCEEEGIIFSFTHTKDKHCLVFTDTAGGPSIAGASSVRFFPGSGNVAEEPVISRITHQQRINSDVASYREWNFLKPADNLSVRKEEANWHKAPAPWPCAWRAIAFRIFTKRGRTASATRKFSWPGSLSFGSGSRAQPASAG